MEVGIAAMLHADSLTDSCVVSALCWLLSLLTAFWIITGRTGLPASVALASIVSNPRPP